MSATPRTEALRDKDGFYEDPALDELFADIGKLEVELNDALRERDQLRADVEALTSQLVKSNRDCLDARAEARDSTATDNSTKLLEKLKTTAEEVVRLHLRVVDYHVPEHNTPRTDALAKTCGSFEQFIAEYEKLERELNEVLTALDATSTSGAKTNLHRIVHDKLRTETELNEARAELNLVLGSPSLRVSAEIAKARQNDIDQLRAKLAIAESTITQLRAKLTNHVQD